MKEGWGWLPYGKLLHYFIDSRSLCGRKRYNYRLSKFGTEFVTDAMSHYAGEKCSRCYEAWCRRMAKEKSDE